MLYFGMKIGETIYINDDVRVTLLRIRKTPHGPAAVIGVEAPKHIEVHREEIWKRIQDIVNRGDK